MRNQGLIEVRYQFHEKRALRRLLFVSACGLISQPQAAKVPLVVYVRFVLRNETTELFIFTPPGAAIRFADGARKSFSIATCLAQ